MKISNLSVSQIIGLFPFKAIATLFVTTNILFINLESGSANTDFSSPILAQVDKSIEGLSGGSTDSHGCGFISTAPSYEMNLKERIDYMRFTVETAGGEPTLLVVGPNSGDSFCVLGDEISGLKPEISGVWEAGYYQIHVGNRTSSRHEFVLDISTDN